MLWVNVLLLVVSCVGLGRAQTQAVETLVDCPVSMECVVVGFSYAGTGGLANEGTFVKNGYILWAETVNSEGGIIVGASTFGVKLIGADDETRSSNTRIIYEELVPMADFFLGPFGSSFSIEASEVAEANNKFIILSNAASNDVYEDHGFTRVYGVGTLARQYCPPAIALYNENGATTFFLAQSTNGFATEVAAGCEIALTTNAAVAMVGKVIFESPINQTIADVIIAAASESGADVILTIGVLDDAPEFVLAGTNQSYDPNGWLMTSAPGNPRFIEENDAENMVGPSQWAEDLQGFEDEFWGDSKDYTKTYEKRFSSDEVSFIAAGASAAGTVLHMAIIEAASIEPTLVESFVRATNREIFFGPIRFAEDGSNADKQIVLTQVRKTEIEVVAPAQHETKSLKYPAPFFSSASSLPVSLPLSLCVLSVAYLFGN